MEGHNYFSLGLKEVVKKALFRLWDGIRVLSNRGRGRDAPYEGGCEWAGFPQEGEAGVSGEGTAREKAQRLGGK